jgi:hypothetical protein
MNYYNQIRLFYQRKRFAQREFAADRNDALRVIGAYLFDAINISRSAGQQYVQSLSLLQIGDSQPREHFPERVGRETFFRNAAAAPDE